MNMKKILFICLIICFVCSIHAVAAAEVDVNATDDSILTDQSIDAVGVGNDLSSYSLSDENSIVRGENDGSFSELQDIIDNDNTGTISLEKNYTFNSDTDADLVQGIVISKDIVINGNDFTIDALSSARIFNIATGSTVVLNGINFVNGGGTSVENGGSIYSSAEGLTIDDCTFTGSYASEDGGALYISGDNCKLYDSTFTANVAGDDGGAICWNGDYGTINNVVFTDNRGISDGDSNSRGGAISLTGDHVNITKSTFSGDSVIYSDGSDITKIDGGAMFVTGDDVIIDGCSFTDCTASNMGGAIYTLGDDNIIKGSTFTSNDAGEDGGALYVSGDNCEVYASNFTGNIAGDDGGAICWTGNYGNICNIICTDNKGICDGESNSRGGAISLTGNHTNVTKSTFSGNSVIYSDGSDISKIDGGAMFITGDDVIIDGCNFTDCTAFNKGGVIYTFGDNNIIKDSTFTSSSAGEDGGALYISGDNCKVYTSDFTGNIAGDDGGAIYWEGKDGIIDGCEFVNNKGISSGNNPNDPSTSKGGTISVIGDNVDISNSNISQSTTINRENGNVGGAVFITGADVDIDNCNFKDCTAEGADGGTIYIIGARTTVTSSNFTDSDAKSGGAIYIDGIDASVIDSYFTNTHARTGTAYTNANLGGAIYIKGNNAAVSGSEFESSGAYSGGIIYLEGSYCEVRDSSFKEGYASNDGGAIYSTGSYSNVINSNFTDNIADGNGGAIYWYGGSNSKYNTVNGSSFLRNVAHAKSTSNTRGGGAVYWSENGNHGSIVHSQFINNSVQSNNKADGGAILWDRCNNVLIDYCTFDGNYITTTATGDVWVQGGTLYLRADSKSVINNSVFMNSISDKEAGAIYIQSKTLNANNPILIVNTKFINNVAKAIAPNVYGGGAVQVKECNQVFFINDTFINNTANNGGAIAIYKANNPIQLTDCVFEGNNATGNGGSIWAQSMFYIYNTSIANSNAENLGGGLYAEGDMIHDNLTFINNTALNGGGLYWNRANVNVRNIVFLNNTALQYGGAMYISKSGHTLTNINMTGNKAFSGSAIYSTAAFRLINSYLIKNQANSSSLTFDTYDESTGEIVLLFKGKDKYLNAIYITGSNRPTCTNVTYWDENGINNTGTSQVTLPNAADPTPEAGQNITVRVYDDRGALLNPDDQYFITDKYGKIHLNLHELVPDVPAEKYGEIYVEAQLTNDDYYTIIKLSSRVSSTIDAIATNTTYHSNSTLSVNVTSGATGNVSVYINDTFLGNITLDNSRGSMELSTLIEGKYLPAGNHTLLFIYNGNAKYDKSNTTAVLEIGKITPTLLLNVTGIGYNLVVNVTAFDGEYGIADVTGNVTIDVAGRTTTIYLANGQGMTIIYGLPIGNYTVNATYNGDNNYYGTTNSTNANVTEKTQTVLVLDVDSEKIYHINETVPIKVTILPNGEGNVTLYINGIPHVLTLQTVGNSTFALFNATELKDGINYVFATYEGTGIYAPSWAQSSFNVIKYNATIGIETANITIDDTEVINITLPEDAEGILNVTVNGTPYYIEIIDGTATLPISGLDVGVYNVTVVFSEDKKYYGAINSTLFNVTKATPSIIVSVENITYGENATIIVTLPEGISGNVTIKLGETVVFTQEPIDGQATFTLSNLAASNYTIEATFNGNEKYTSVSNSTNFTVFKATPVVNVTVEDIYYGDAEHIVITVNTEGNVTVKVNGVETILNITSAGNGTYVYDLAVGNYPVEVTFNGNENYTSLTVTDDFNVYQANTTIDVQVQNITVWDKEIINVTLATNATGNVTININGVAYNVKLINGIAQLNLTNLTIGHKIVWVFYEGDKNYTANKTMVEFDVKQRTPEINVVAQNITVGQDGNITVTVPANATGFVVIQVIGDNTYFEFVSGGKAVVYPKGLKEGNYTVIATYYGTASDNYTQSTAETTFKVSKLNVTLEISVDNITYSETANITVTVPAGVTGNITIRINGTDRNITLTIVDGKVTWLVDDLAAGNYTVTAVYNGNDAYNVSDTESATFNVFKADPDLNILMVTATTFEKATIYIIIDGRTAGEFVNITGPDKVYYNVPIGADGTIVLETDGTLDYRMYDVTVSYGGNDNFTEDSASISFTPTKISTYGLNVTAMNITVGDDEIITVEVPNGVDDVVIWVDGTRYRNHSFTGNKATFNVTGLKEGLYTVTATVNDTEFEHINFTTIFTVSKIYPPINITVVNATGIFVNDTVKIIVSVPKDTTENVTIVIDGIELTNVTVNGNATFYVPGITLGNKTVVASYPGDDKYLYNSTVANFTVSKRQSSVNVTVNATSVGNDVIINVTIPSNAVGYVIVNVDGTNYTVNTTDGKGSVVIKDLGNATHTVHVIYLGDDQYLPSENSTSFGIAKVNTTISITVESIDYGNAANITVTVLNDATGNITIRINETKSITLPVVNGKVNWIVDGLAADNYTVYADYSGDGKYNVNSTSKSFEVRQISPEIKIVTVISTADDNATIIVEIDSRVTENVTVTVGGKSYTAKPVNGIAVITTDVLDYGDYTVEASYPGDKNFTADSDTLEFTTNKTDDYLINITATDIKVGNNTNITVYVPADAEGIVVIELNGTNYTATISDGKAVLNNISTLKEWVYDVVAYFGNEKYANKTVETRFAVSKVNTPININVTSIFVGDKAIINVTVPDDVTENVTIEIDGVKYSKAVTNGEAIFEIENLSAGVKTVIATYAGDDKYVYSSTTSNFEVYKRNSTVNVTATATVVGEDAIINVTIPDDATGYVIVNVDGVNYTVNTTGGKGSIAISGLLNATHTVHVTYVGDDKYLSSENDTTFGIAKVPSTVTVTVDNITVGDVAAVNITVITGGTGNVTITIGDEYSNTVGVTDGVISIIVSGLSVGNKTVNVTYNGDDRFLPSSNSTNFTVGQASAQIELVVQNITYGDVESIVAFINATGNVTIKVGDETVGTVNIVDGKVVYDIPNLNAGNYTVEVIYNGNADVNPTSAKANFTVAKATPEVIVNVEDIVYGNPETIVVNVSADGNVTIKVNGEIKAAEQALSDDGYTLTLNGLAVGKYTVEATYNGNANYNNLTVTTVFNVIKANTTVDIEGQASINVGETQIINITVNGINATGEVIVILDGNSSNVNLIDGKANFTTQVLPVGNHTIIVVYEGNQNLTGNWSSFTFEVVKLNSELTISVTNTTTDSIETIRVNVTEGATGSLVITVDGKDYYADLDDGVATIELSNLANKTYTVHVKYLGDENYTSCEGDASFNVAKVNSTVSVKVDNITLGDVAIVNITVPSDATGNVTVEIVGVGTYTVNVANGIGSLVVKDLKVGDYTVKVTYNGDGKYLPNNNETTFKVSKVESTSDDIQVIDQGNGTVVINVPGKEGNVTVKLGDKTYNATVVNGTAVVALTNATPGVHKIDVVYSGDENHTGASTKANVTIPKYETPMSIEVVAGKVDETTVVTVTVPENATGNVTIEINGKSYSAKVNDGVAVFEVDGLLSGNKTVTATYSGDDNYVLNSTTANFTVLKNPAPISADADNSTAGQVTITVTLPDDATGYVIVNVEGVDYGINLTAGDKSVVIPVINSGDYTATVTYLGDEKYLANSTTIDYHASSNKTDPNIGVEVDNVPIGEDVPVKVTIPEGGDGNVTVTINGTSVTVPVKGGENIIYVPNVGEGTHNVTVEYSGNDQFKPQTVNRTVSVFRSIIAENITRGWNSPYDYKAEFLDKDGHVLADTEVQFIVNGQTYTARTNSQGIAYLNVTKLDIGVYTVTCVNPVTGEQRNATTTIVKRLIENKDITMDFVDGTYYVVRAIGDDGKPVGKDEFVDIYVNTKHYSCRTDENGYARLKINLNPRTYDITAEYKSYKVTNKLVVKQTLKLVKKTVTVKKGKTLTLKATLKWSNGKAIKGKKIVFKFKGKKYSAKTNSKGLAKVTIKSKVTKKLKAGKKYKYNAAYITNYVKGTVKVKK